MDPNGNYCLPCGIELAKWGGAALLAAIGVQTAIHEFPDPKGGNLADPTGGFDVGQGGFTAHPSGPSVVSTPAPAEAGATVHATPVNGPRGASVLVTPATPQQLRDNIVYASPLRNALGLKPQDGWIAHHNIPRQHRNHPAVQASVRGGFELDGSMNGTKVIGQSGGHPQYNERIGRELEELWQLGASEGWTDEQYAEKLKGISDRERGAIEEDDDFVHNR